MDITHSNFPPSAKEEPFIRALLKQKNEELITINENVAKVKNELASSEEAIKELKESSRLTRVALDMYKDHQKHLIASQKILNHRVTITTKNSSLNASKLKVSSDLQELVVPDLESRRIAVDAEVESLKEMCANLKALSLEIDEDIRCQQYAQNINTESLEAYSTMQKFISAAIEKLHGAFRPIKRIPDEIWMDIWGYAVSQHIPFWENYLENTLWLPALKLTHVCRAWRRVIVGSPVLWTTIYSRSAPGKQPSIDLLKLWARYCKGKVPRVINDQSGGESPSTIIDLQAVLGTTEIVGYDIIQAYQASNSTPEQYPSTSFPAMVTIYAFPTGRAPKVQEQLLKRFTTLGSLSLCNVLPPQGLNYSNALVVLSVTLTMPHDTYPLRRHLRHSLKVLRLQHFDVENAPVLTELVRLPNLHTLSVTPLEYKIVEMLKLPKLSALKISQPVKWGACSDQWLDSFIPLCPMVTELQLFGQEHKCGKFDALQVFMKLHHQLPKLQRVRFAHVDLDGSVLADFLDTTVDAQVSAGPRLKKLTIDGCIGVSRWDCDRLVQFVDKLNVYDTVYGETSRASSSKQVE